MPEDPFSLILSQLGDLLKTIEKNAGKPITAPIDPRVERELAKAEAMVTMLGEVVDEEIQRKGKDLNLAMQQVEHEPKKYSEAEQAILRRCRDLGVNAVVLRVGLLRAIREKNHPKLRQMGKNTKKSIQKRRSKFKGMDGGDQKWKRL